MSVRGFRSLVVVSLALLAMLPAVSAQACSIAGQSRLQDLLDLDIGRIAGVYEQETVAWAPSILIRGESTASVVTRYWGQPPANVGLQYEGEWLPWIWGMSQSCAGLVDSDFNVIYSDGRVGTVGYGLAPLPSTGVGPSDSPEEQAATEVAPWHRSAPAVILENGQVTGSLSDSEAEALSAAFGEPTVLDIGNTTRIQATIRVWAPVATVAGVIALVVFVLWHIQRRRNASDDLAMASQRGSST